MLSDTFKIEGHVDGAAILNLDNVSFVQQVDNDPEVLKVGLNNGGVVTIHGKPAVELYQIFENKQHNRGR